jgi:hypothetical protein
MINFSKDVPIDRQAEIVQSEIRLVENEIRHLAERRGVIDYQLGELMVKLTDYRGQFNRITKL